jgi:hypothetical protein
MHKRKIEINARSDRLQSANQNRTFHLDYCKVIVTTGSLGTLKSKVIT